MYVMLTNSDNIVSVNDDMSRIVLTCKANMTTDRYKLVHVAYTLNYTFETRQMAPLIFFIMAIECDKKTKRRNIEDEVYDATRRSRKRRTK